MPMASLNVAEWSVDQVADWLSGLGPTVARYVPALRERGLNGAKLLTLRCDDLEYLGMHVIGHQELLLEAVEHLRNFQYEVSRECVQQLALRVSVVATTLARALRHHPDARLETQTLADVARTVHAVKPLVCWLDRWPLCSSGTAAASLAERKAALLKLSLEAATCAQRDRFAEQPARAVAAAAATTAATADYIIQDVSDPMILQPASLDSVTLRQAGKPLGFDVVPSFCGHHQLADIRFGSPAHASGAVHIGDEIVQVGNQCVIGWSGEAVLRACSDAGVELALRLRRRAARAPPALATPQLRPRRRPAPPYVPPPPPAPREPSESDESEPLSPPASPTHLHPDHTRMYPPKPRTAVQRRHTISGDSPLYKRPSHTIEQFWQELKQQRWGHERSSADVSRTSDLALYARDKAVSCSTGLEMSPRPRTCPELSPHARCSGPSERGPPPPARCPAPPARCPPPPARGPGPAADRGRAKLDKAHSTPAYDFDASIDEPGPLATQTIPESPTTPTDSPLALNSADKADRILDFKKSSSQIGEAILQRGRRSNAEAPCDGDEGLAVDRDDSDRNEPDRDEPDMEEPDRDELGRNQLDKEESDTERLLETINVAMLEHRRRSGQTAAHHHADSTQSRAPPRLSRVPTPPPRPAPPPRPVGPAPAAVPAGPAPSTAPGRVTQYPVLRAVARPDEPPTSPLKPVRSVDATHISAPLRHITKHDIRVIPSERCEMPAINSIVSEQGAAGAGVGPGAGPGGSLRRRSPPAGRAGDIVMGAQAHSEATPTRGHALSPTSAVRGIFPTSKSRSLKKKSSILAKRRSVPARALAARGAAGGVWQRVRTAAAARWARRHLLLTHSLLYAYRTPECSKADCMIYLEGFTVAAAGEVKSRAHAFKVYHTGTAFYFAADSRDAQLAWIQLIHRATLLPSLATHTDVSKQFSETDYSETESDTESPHKESERERSRDRDKEKDKSKFGSLKKLTHRMQRSESHENVPHSSTSLDRKYLRFFYRNKSKDDAKLKKTQAGVPVPTEHYRSYRRVAPAAAPGPAPPLVTVEGAEEGPRSRRLPKPINYIHASNPNLLDFDKSDFVTKPTLHVPKPKPKTENLVGFVTLEQFMLKKQAEERRQVYTNRVLMGVEHQNRAAAQHDLMQRLDNIVPDVIYGEVCSSEGGSAASSTGGGQPISVRGKDGYEKIVYRDEMPTTLAPDRWRRNDKVHSSSASARAALAQTQLQLAMDSRNNAASGSPAGVGSRATASRRGVQYPHLQCPPTFVPESYSLARRPPRAGPTRDA